MMKKAPMQLDREIAEALARSRSSGSFAGTVRGGRPRALSKSRHRNHATIAAPGGVHIWRYLSDQGWTIVKSNVPNTTADKVLKIYRSESYLPGAKYAASPTKPSSAFVVPSLDKWSKHVGPIVYSLRGPNKPRHSYEFRVGEGLYTIVPLIVEGRHYGYKLAFAPGGEHADDLGMYAMPQSAVLAARKHHVESFY